MRGRCYCPREGYKVASADFRDVVHVLGVTVPVRGIRLHLLPMEWLPPVHGCYCPREGYKVASGLD